MKRIIYLREDGGKTAISLPVTPAEFRVFSGMNIEVVNIHAVGDATIAGLKTMQSIQLECMFPAHKYPFNTSGASTNPYYYTKIIENWVSKRVALRFIVSGTKINVPIFVEEVAYGESDGTNDMYVSLTLRERTVLKQVRVQSKKANSKNPSPAASNEATITYKIKRGDTLSAICRKYYGSASYYPKLAKYNSIKNPNLIYAGDTLKIPPKEKL